MGEILYVAAGAALMLVAGRGALGMEQLCWTALRVEAASVAGASGEALFAHGP